MNRVSLPKALLPAMFAFVPATLKAGDDPATIEPPDVYKLMEMVHQEIELIRVEMGQPKVDDRIFDVEGAQPREVYFQATSLLQAASRLCMELIGDQPSKHKVPEGAIGPKDVFAVVDAALLCLRKVKGSIGVSESSVNEPRDGTKTPTDVFHSIVLADRQLNELLESHFSSSDSFQQVTLALHHAMALRGHFPGEKMPATPHFVRAKQTSEVYSELTRCFEQIRRIGRLSGVQILQLRQRKVPSEWVFESDVYSVASLLISELAHLHLQLTGEKPANDSYPPGRKFPSHVHQRTRLLALALEQLERLVKQNPNWLGNQ